MNQKSPLDTVLFEVSLKCKEILDNIDHWTKRLYPGDMTQKQRDKFEAALNQFEEELAQCSGKLSALVNSNPNQYLDRHQDIKDVLTVVNRVQRKIEDFQDQIEDANEGFDEDEEIDPSEKAQLEQVLKSPEFKAAMDRITADRLSQLKAAQKAEEEDGPVQFLPAITRHPAKYPPREESYCATRLVRPRVFEVTIPLDNGLYFIVYFNFLEQNGYTQATCYWGDVFDFAQKAVSEPYPGAGYVMLSRPFQKKYPHVARVYGMHENNQDCTKPYLTTIGWEHQPKEWFLSVRLYDFDYFKLITYSPLDCPEAMDAIDDLKDASLAMMRDILRSDAKTPKQLMKELFGI